MEKQPETSLLLTSSPLHAFLLLFVLLNPGLKLVMLLLTLPSLPAGHQGLAQEQWPGPLFNMDMGKATICLNSPAHKTSYGQLACNSKAVTPWLFIPMCL